MFDRNRKRANRKRIPVKKSQKTIIVTAIAVVLAVTICIILVVFIPKSKKDEIATNSQIEQSASNSILSSSVSSELSSSSLVSSTSSSTISSSSSLSVSSSSRPSVSSSSRPSVSSSGTSSKAVMALGDGVTDWNLMLINPKNPLPNGFKVSTEKIPSEFANASNMLLDARVVSYFKAMCTAAKKDGVRLFAVSTYRTRAKQTSLYNNQVNKQRKKYPDLSQAEVEKIAATISAIPGTSEHEAGLAVDFNSVEEEFENTSAANWLRKHAAEYGFILRYPKGKESVTGIIYEPWHYRFIGEKHAKKINELGYCFEEYVEFLKNAK